MIARDTMRVAGLYRNCTLCKELLDNDHRLSHFIILLQVYE